jgi:membrane fusion protein (multidrug efflux system)
MMNAVSETIVAQADAQSMGQASAAPSPKSKLLLRLIIVALVLIVIGLVARWWWVEGRWIESTDNAYVQGDIVTLSTRIDGDIIAIHVKDNQRVAAGAPLLTLDPADWQARLDQARGAMGEAEAAIVTSRRQVEQARGGIAQADAAIEQAQAEQVRAAADATRSASLVGSGWTSRQANDTAIATARKADAAMGAARAQHDIADQTLTVAQAVAAQAESRLIAARATATLAANALSYTVLRAPFDGIVGNRAAQIGQHVTPGQQLLALAPPPEKLFIVANFKETQLRLIRPGQKVRVTPDIDSRAAVEGRVDSIAPATGALFSILPPENATGNFTKVVQRVPVKIVLDQAADHAQAGWLRAGLSVTAEIDTRGPDAKRRGLVGIILATFGLN